MSDAPAAIRTIRTPEKGRPAGAIRTIRTPKKDASRRLNPKNPNT
jgi:hypothetical protein